MNNKIYILAFNTILTDPDVLHKKIDSDTEILDWSHYIKHAYIIVSALSAQSLQKRLKSTFGNESFIIIEVSLENYQGWLPKEAWDWIKKYDK